jgi:hypothetical protein
MLMRSPISVCRLSKEERKVLEAGLRSSDAFVLRRCQILLASSHGERSPRIAEKPTLRPTNCAQRHPRVQRERGLDALKQGSSRPTEVHAAFDESSAPALLEMLHHDPRKFGKDGTLWTLQYAAQVSFEEGLTHRQVSAETIRATLVRLGVRWQRAKRWIESPDPE